MKILYNKNLMGFEPAVMDIEWTFCWRRLYLPTTNRFQNSQTWLLNMPPEGFDFNVYKQTNVNITIRSWEKYNKCTVFSVNW